MASKIKITRLSIILILFIVLLLGYFLILNPLLSHWKDLNRRIEVVRLQYLRNSSTVSNFNDYVNHYKEFESISTQNKKDEEEVAFFLKEIETFVNGLNININDIKPLPDEEESQAHIFLIDVEMESSIIDFMEFLHKIASSKNLIRIEKMSLITKGQRGHKLTIKLIISKTFLV